jgi:hypothetical protein
MLSVQWQGFPAVGIVTAFHGGAARMAYMSYVNDYQFCRAALDSGCPGPRARISCADGVFARCWHGIVTAFYGNARHSLRVRKCLQHHTRHRRHGMSVPLPEGGHWRANLLAVFLGAQW